MLCSATLVASSRRVRSQLFPCRFAKPRVESAIGLYRSTVNSARSFPPGLRNNRTTIFPSLCNATPSALQSTVPHGGNDFASAVEAFVQASIHIVTHQRDLSGAANRGVSCDHDLSVRLHGYACRRRSDRGPRAPVNEDHKRTGDKQATNIRTRFVSLLSNCLDLGLTVECYEYSATIQSLCRSKSND